VASVIRDDRYPVSKRSFEVFLLHTASPSDW
jgi:hypothetical protein